MRHDPTTYEEDKVLIRYVWRHYGHLMTPLEQRAGKAIFMRTKARAASDPPLKELVLERYGQLDDPDIQAVLADGEEAFLHRTAKRLLVEHKSEIFVNRCPNCNRVVVSPKAKLCLWCHYNWHDS